VPANAPNRDGEAATIDVIRSIPFQPTARAFSVLIGSEPGSTLLF
jgi:hypothetical protein